MTPRKRVGAIRFPFRKNIYFALLATSCVTGVIFCLNQRLLNSFRTGINNISLLCQQPWSANHTDGPFFYRRHAIDCPAIFSGGDALAVYRAKREKPCPRMTEYGLYKLLANCSNLHRLYYFHNKPLSQDEADFPIAFSVLANEHADYLLKLLNAIYAPQNVYCVHVDLKSSSLFRQTVARFVRCLPNVLLASTEEAVVWGGYSMVQAMLSCIFDLLKHNSLWRYVVMLNNHDFPLRTNRELVAVFKLLNGSNDVELTHFDPDRIAFHYMPEYNEEGAPKARKSKQRRANTTPPHNLVLYKGSQHAVLSRDFVHFAMNDPRSLALQQFLKDTSIPDETLWSTLVHNEQILRAPGAYPGRCLNVKKKDWMTRYTEWEDHYTYTCGGVWRHGICIFGYGDLRSLVTRPALFANKFYPPVDLHAIDCLHELIFNRTYYQRYDIGELDQLRHSFRHFSAIRFASWLAVGNRSDDFPC